MHLILKFLVKIIITIIIIIITIYSICGASSLLIIIQWHESFSIKSIIFGYRLIDMEKNRKIFTRKLCYSSHITSNSGVEEPWRPMA